jgi:hypothetical protein
MTTTAGLVALDAKDKLYRVPVSGIVGLYLQVAGQPGAPV